MPLPKRFESYKRVLITPHSVEMRPGKWTIGGVIRPENDSSAAEESFHDKGYFAASHDEAIEKAMVYGKRLVDDRTPK